MRYYLFLDDQRFVDQCPRELPTPPEGVRWLKARSTRQFMQVVERYGLPEFVSFDADLGTGFGAGSGMEAATWLKEIYCNEHELPLPQCQSHSADMQMRRDIERYLAS